MQGDHRQHHRCRREQDKGKHLEPHCSQGGQPIIRRDAVQGMHIHDQQDRGKRDDGRLGEQSARKEEHRRPVPATAACPFRRADVREQAQQRKKERQYIAAFGDPRDRLDP